MNTQKLQHENCIKNRTKYHFIIVLFAQTLNLISMRKRKINKLKFIYLVTLRIQYHNNFILKLKIFKYDNEFNIILKDH